MNKLKTLTIVALLTTALAGCNQDGTTYKTTDASQTSNTGRFIGLEEDVTIVKDTETGCKYIYIDAGSFKERVVSMTPLMKDSETVECDK